MTAIWPTQSGATPSYSCRRFRTSSLRAMRQTLCGLASVVILSPYRRSLGDNGRRGFDWTRGNSEKFRAALPIDGPLRIGLVQGRRFRRWFLLNRRQASRTLSAVGAKTLKEAAGQLGHVLALSGPATDQSCPAASSDYSSSGPGVMISSLVIRLLRAAKACLLHCN